MEQAVSNQHAAISENQHQNLFTAKGAKDEEGLPRMNTDDTDEQERIDNPDTQKLRVPGTPAQRAKALVRRIGEACDELERLAKENPELVGRVTRGAEEQKEAYLRLKERLKVADAAPRCRWVKQDGTTCGSPQMKKHIYCFAHRQMMEALALALRLPALEDANAIQVGIMRIQKALIEDTISTKKAGLLLYSMQLALQNVGQTTFGQAKMEELVRETVDEEEALSEKAFSTQHSAVSEKQHQNLFTAKDAKDAKESAVSENQNQNQKPLTTKGAKDEEVLPRISTDDTDQQKGLAGTDADGLGWPDEAKQVEWKPTPDMYRMDTREGIEAYEARFGMKIKPGLDRAIGSSDHRAIGGHPAIGTTEKRGDGARLG